MSRRKAQQGMPRYAAAPDTCYAPGCRYCQRYRRACGRPHGRHATEYGAAEES